MPSTKFVSGPAGSGKTTAAIEHIRKLVLSGVSGDEILVLVPQRALGWPYYQAFVDPSWPPGSEITIATLGGLARRGIDLFWPLIATQAGFESAAIEPTFLTIETAQYFMAGFVHEAIKTGVFDSISVAPFEIMRQILDNLSKAAVNRFPIDEVAGRLTAAWGDRHSSRPVVYRAAEEVALRFRRFCLHNVLLDFSLQVDVFMDVLLKEPLYEDYMRNRFRHLVADNLEESFPVAGDFIRWLWPSLETALLLYDTDGGYRVFLGADPHGMRSLGDLTEQHEERDILENISPSVACLAEEFSHILVPESFSEPHHNASPRDGFEVHEDRFFPQMVEWVTEKIESLVQSGVSPREIVVLAPFMNDSLRFSLTTRLTDRGIPVVSHRPSRALHDEPSVRTMLTWMALAHSHWPKRPPVEDVSNALYASIDDLDPVRAWLLAQIVYAPGRQELGSFDRIEPAMRDRITYRAGENFERLRQWLLDYYTEDMGKIPPDHFFSRIFGEILSQPGFGFHGDLEAGRAIGELVESAKRFRQTVVPDGTSDWENIAMEYVELVQQGLLAAFYTASWRDEQKDAVFLAPAHTFLMRNRWADYQFWLDVGSNYWWERLEQPLTHPYVLSRDYPPGQVWTDSMEFEARREALRRLVVGLARRCRQKVFVTIAHLGEQGFEQRGPLLRVFHEILQRHPLVERVSDGN